MEAEKIIFHGNHYQIDTVKGMLEEEIRLYEKRLVVLKRSPLERQESLIETYEDMIRVRKEILEGLSNLINP
ncbi:MAG: hypothetical protein H7A00_00565 [Hahellaceae bacterium]|nr:hypothetical protein [Hahellaceae bacterium]